MHSIKKVIYGIESKKLSEFEKDFYSSVNPAGFIVFKRNIENPSQLKNLIKDLHACTSNPHLLILIDQEGGRVARLRPPHFRKSRPAGDFAKLANININIARQAVFINHYLMGVELKELGINVNCAPMCDILFDNSHNIIGDRSFGSDKKTVIALAKVAMDGLISAGIMPVIKHIPGHGRSLVDSHEDLPRIDEDLEVLEKTDFAVFNALAYAPFAMTAHIIYTALDVKNCATHSPTVINYIKEEIGYNNILLSDDICMNALKDSITERANKAFSAGCDIVLHCNGTIEEYSNVAKISGELNERQIKIIKKAFKTCQNENKLSSEYSSWIGNYDNQKLEDTLESFFSVIS